jgi:hypothetical protein
VTDHTYALCTYCGYRVAVCDAASCDNHDGLTAFFCKAAFKGTGKSCFELHQTWHR